MINKTDIKKNTLVQEIIRIDLLKIDDISDVLSDIDKIMNENEFSFSKNDVYGMNITVNDPEELITQKFITNVNRSTNYQYVKKDEKFVINEYVVIFQKSNFKEYSSIEPYIDILTQIINCIISREKVLIKRIGIRKINKVIGKKLDVIKAVFNQEHIKDEYLTKYEGFSNINKEVLVNDENRNCVNILKSLDNGIATIDGENIECYSSTLDIDAYCREFSYDNLNDIKEKMNSLTNNVFEIFSSYENNTLTKILKNEDVDNFELIEVSGKNE